MWKWLKCILLGHDWFYIKAYGYVDTSLGVFRPSTNAVRKCNRCKKIEHQRLYHCPQMTLEQLNGPNK